MNNKRRCAWCVGDPLYEAYHDTEWGVPLRDDERALFEFLTLETFQAGLSWITILRKREHFRAAFDNFDYQKIALYGQKKVDELLQNAGIVRNRRKIEASINNAKCFMEVQKNQGSFSQYIWRFVNNRPIQNSFETSDELPPTTALAHKISTDLKKKGFRFVGPTVVYAHMQATGMVNDHETGCFRYKEILTLA